MCACASLLFGRVLLQFDGRKVFNPSIDWVERDSLLILYQLCHLIEKVVIIRLGFLCNFVFPVT